MSSLYLLLGLLATFATIVVAGLRIGVVVEQRKKAIRTLEAQVGNASTSLRQQELSRSFMERALLPLGSKLGRGLRKVLPLDLRDRIAQQLDRAGNPAHWDADKLAGLKILAGIAGVGVGVVLGQAMGAAGTGNVLIVLALAAMGFFAPTAVLSGKAERRQDEIRRALADTIDLLTISVEAGLGLDAAMAQVVTNVPGPLSQEISRLLQEVRLGVPRVDAFRNLSERTDVAELNSFILAMVQAESFGVSISGVLRAQSQELRMKRRQRAEEQAMKIPIKILFPLIFCVLPVLLTVILGPGVIRIATNFIGVSDG
jgi:tight adherence protein C